MLKKLSVILFFFFSLYITTVTGNTVNLTNPQSAPAEFRDNNCVTCHAQLARPPHLSSRYAEWHISAHKEKAAGAKRNCCTETKPSPE
jgi:hypothetical protein